MNLSIIESSTRILTSLSAEIVAEIVMELQSQNIKLYTGEKVIKVDANSVYTESGKLFKADIKLWAAGIKAPDILKKLELSTNDKNQLLLRDTLQIIDDDYIFAIGDCANFNDKKQLLPATAQLAHQQAKFLAKSLVDHIKKNKPLAKFSYEIRGTIISASGKEAIGELKTSKNYKIKLHRKIAYFSYRFLYRRYQASKVTPFVKTKIS